MLREGRIYGTGGGARGLGRGRGKTKTMATMEDQCFGLHYEFVSEIKDQGPSCYS